MLYCAILLRNSCRAASISASGLRSSSPLIKSPRKPRNSLPKRAITAIDQSSPSMNQTCNGETPLLVRRGDRATRGRGGEECRRLSKCIFRSAGALTTPHRFARTPPHEEGNCRILLRINRDYRFVDEITHR